MSLRVAIVGGGLSGLHAAELLVSRGIGDHVLFEARDSFGGRIRSEGVPGDTHRGAFDLGATWFWPEIQPAFARFVADSGLAGFPQPEQGDVLIERSTVRPIERFAGMHSAPPAMRVVGGMGTLVDATRRRLDASRLRTGTRVTQLCLRDGVVDVETVDRDGRTSGWQADRILLALPPRLAASTIRFAPDLPAAVMAQWQDTPTWMAPHAKYVAIYDEPFWRRHGLSGAARSLVGPLAEIHDASSPGGAAALFGFPGVAAEDRADMAPDTLRAHCRAQLIRLFGPEAATPAAELLADWSAEPFTATRADWRSGADHAHPPVARVTDGPWRDLLVGIASEWSPGFPGYLAGAIDAARRGVATIGGQPWE